MSARLSPGQKVYDCFAELEVEDQADVLEKLKEFHRTGEPVPSDRAPDNLQGARQARHQHASLLSFAVSRGWLHARAYLRDR